MIRSNSLAAVSTRDGVPAVCRVMLIDDSLVVRSILERMIGDMPGVQLVESLPSAEAALAALDRARPHVIVLDIELPGISGLAALPELLERAPRSRVLILSSNCPEGGPAAVEALALGASDTLCKPGRSAFSGTFGETFKARLLALGGVDLPDEATDFPGALAAQLPPMATAARGIVPNRLCAIAVAASTGGIPAFGQLLERLDADITVPIFLTQHLPDAFIPYYGQQLATATRRLVRIGADGMEVQPGTLYLAPGGGHMEVVAKGQGAALRISRAPQASGCCPSADPMFASLAALYGGAWAAVVLSGMGNDGASGAAAAVRAGAPVLVQDPETSVVWGMPGAVSRAGLARAILEPAAIAAFINQLAPAPTGYVRDAGR